MIISKKKNLPSLNIKINEKNLDDCDSYKYLGVYIDKNLSWRPHVDYLCKKISKACGALAKLRHCVGIDTLKTIYYALVNSYLRYGLLAWGSASSSVLQPLNVLNNKVLRIMTFAPLGRLDTSIIYDHLQILNLEKTYLLEAGKFIFKSKNNTLPLKSIATHFSRVQNTTHGHFTRSCTRSCKNLLPIVPFHLLSSYAQKSLQLKAEQIWSTFPLDLKQAGSFSIFKAGLKKYLLNHD